MRKTTVILIVLALAYAVIQHNYILIAAGIVAGFRVGQALIILTIFKLGEQLHKKYKR